MNRIWTVGDLRTMSLKVRENITYLDESKDIIFPWLKTVGKWWEKRKIFNQKIFNHAMVLQGKRCKPNICITSKNIRQRQQDPWLKSVLAF